MNSLRLQGIQLEVLPQGLYQLSVASGLIGGSQRPVVGFRYVSREPMGTFCAQGNSLASQSLFFGLGFLLSGDL